ncbi:MAG: hypothetical protein RL616_376, partial [Verrucomicrobiota bacterium]
ALATLEFNRGESRQPALAATGGNIVKRVRRLLAQPETPRSALTPVLSAAILTVTIVAIITIINWLRLAVGNLFIGSCQQGGIPR